MGDGWRIHINKIWQRLNYNTLVVPKGGRLPPPPSYWNISTRTEDRGRWVDVTSVYCAHSKLNLGDKAYIPMHVFYPIAV